MSTESTESTTGQADSIARAITRDRPRVNPPTCDLTADDMFDSLTGFDEIAVRQAFGGVNVYALSKTDPLQLARCLVFVDQRRRDLKDREAFKAAQGFTLAEVYDYFADDEVDPEDPDTDQGKDAAATETTPPS